MSVPAPEDHTSQASTPPPAEATGLTGDDAEAIVTALIDLFPHPVWVKDADDRYIAVNEPSAAAAKYASTTDMIGRNDHDLFPAEIAGGLAENDRIVRETGAIRDVSERLVSPTDHRVRYIEARKAPVLRDGDVIGTVGFALNQTETAHLEVAAADMTRLNYLRMIESLPFDLVRYDRSCRRIFMNAHFARSIGPGAEEHLGKAPRESWPNGAFDVSGDEFQARIEATFTSGRSQTFESRGGDPPVIKLLHMLPERGHEGDVESVLMVGVDISEMVEYRTQATHLAFHDTLTDLPNRTMFRERMGAASGLAKRHDTMFGVLLLDVDRFKDINDSIGHSHGDDLLRQVADRLRNCVRPYDLVARLGGDEFAVLMEDVHSPGDIRRLAERLLATFDDPFEVAGLPITTSASIGIAAYPHDGEGIDDILRAADSAMYEAKRLGRDTIQMHSRALSEAVTERLTVEQELRTALQHDELALAYQPIVTLQGEVRIAAAEALLRWTNPRLGFVSPGVFIPIAEETGLIRSIGRWVFEQSCQTARLINEGRTDPIVISMNVSARQFLRHDLVAEMRRTLDETGADPRWLKVEITESVLLDDEPSTRAALAAISEMGMRIAIDDFGTGFSSLSYLAAFPSDVVKIDRSFVKEITTDEATRHVVRAVIGMASNLQKQLVAEGIETEEQARLLAEWGCQRGQGYHFGRPAPLDELRAALAAQDANSA